MKFFKHNLKLVFVIIFLIITNNSNAQMFWNQTCQFAGTNSSYISVPNSPDINLTDNFTLETWVNPASVTGTTDKGIISKGSTLGISLRYALKISTTGRVTIFTNGLLRATSTVALAANTWTHVCVTFTSSTNTFAIYLNGVLNTSAVVGGALPSSNTDSLYLGIAGAGNSYSGQLDEVRIWNKTLSAAEIGQFYRSSIGTSGGIHYGNLVLSFTFQKNNSGGTLFSTTDWTGKGNNGNPRNVTGVSQSNTQYTIISPNECLSLNGTNEYVTGGSNALVSPSSQITLEAWIYPRAFTTSPSIISKNSSTSFKLGLSSSGKVQFVPKGGASTLESKFTLTANRWTHVASTYNGTTTALYINGVLDTSTNAITGAIGTNTDSILIGCDRPSGSLTNYFNGFIDEVRISGYAKTQTQIAAYLYRSIDSVNKPNPAGVNVCYNLDGSSVDNADNGPRLYMRDSAKFTHVAGVSNQPVSPMLRDDSKPFPDGYSMRTSNKRVPLTGGTGTTDDTINIPFNINISDINVFVAINHTDETNLDVSLIAPNGETVILSTDGITVGAYDHLITIFDDQATNLVTSTSFTSFSPSIRPEGNLNNTFGNDYTQGVWILRVTDDGGNADTGRIAAWGMQFNNSATSGRVTTLNLTTLIQGFWDGASMVPDTMKVYLRNTTAPYTITDSGKALSDNQGKANLSFINTGNVTKYITVKHRNSLDTWSATGVVFRLDSATTYDFTTSATKAYGSNLVLKGGKYCMYNGNVNGDIGIDLLDLTQIYNDANSFLVGYVKTDLTGDNFVELTDLTLAFNNASNFATIITPP